MKVTIKVDCDTINELALHLSQINRSIKKEAKKQKLNPEKDEFEGSKKIMFQDDNCYGEHLVWIRNEIHVKQKPRTKPKN